MRFLASLGCAILAYLIFVFGVPAFREFVLGVPSGGAVIIAQIKSAWSWGWAIFGYLLAWRFLPFGREKTELPATVHTKEKLAGSTDAVLGVLTRCVIESREGAFLASVTLATINMLLGRDPAWKYDAFEFDELCRAINERCNEGKLSSIMTIVAEQGCRGRPENALMMAAAYLWATDGMADKKHVAVLEKCYELEDLISARSINKRNQQP